MRILLDTNAFLRWTAGVNLPRSVERILLNSNTEPFISLVTVWEIVLKPKLELGVHDVELAIEQMSAALLPIKVSHLAELSLLPLDPEHRDPFDRLLIAQALVEGMPIVTSDTRFPNYNNLRVMWD